MEMLSPLKQIPSLRSAKGMRDLLQIHIRQHLERSAWRTQLEALRSTLENLPSGQSPLDTGLRTENASMLFLRERCEDLESRLAEARDFNAQLHEQFYKKKAEDDALMTELREELRKERRKRQAAQAKVVEFIRAVNPPGVWQHD
jgi:chromosome segregation ATPase